MTNTKHLGSHINNTPSEKSRRFSQFSLHTAIIPLLIMIATLITYFPSIKSGFILNWDDNKYVVENTAAHGFSIANIKTAFSSIYVSNYAPLHIMSYMLDYTLWGLNPTGYHITNIMLHGLNGIFFYHLLRLLNWLRLPALLAALLFVLHPVQVESVAWISQRKNLLSMFLLLMSFIFYIKAYNQKTHYKAYFFSLFTFTLALLTKSVTVFLPIVFILYDLTHTERYDRNHRAAICSVVPFLLLSAACCVLTFITQHEARTGWHGDSPLATAFTMFPVSMEYLGMLVWPAKLSALYDPVVYRSLLKPTVLASLVVLFGILGGAVVMSRRRPREMFWFWFSMLSIAPVSQIIPLTTIMNDRYLYFPLIGIAALLFGFLSPAIVRSDTKSRIIIFISLFILVTLAIVSGRRALIWNDSYTLWTDAVRKAPGSRFARQGLAESLESRGDLIGASEHYMAALSRDPGSPELNSQAGVVFAQIRQFPKAVSYLATAVRLRPENDGYRMNLASALLESREFSSAIEQIKMVDQRAPSARNSCMLGALYEKIGDASSASFYYGRIDRYKGTLAPAECAGIRSIIGL